MQRPLDCKYVNGGCDEETEDGSLEATGGSLYTYLDRLSRDYLLEYTVHDWTTNNGTILCITQPVL